MCEDVYKETVAIDNLAATLLIAEEANQNASYIHGAKLMNPLNDSITAIVSGFAGKSSATTIQGLVRGRHSFSDIIVIDDHGDPGSASEFTPVQGRGLNAMRMKNMTRYPGSSPSRDFCHALEHVETPYFAFSNVFRLPTNQQPITGSAGQIMIPCLPASSQYCDDSCQIEAAGAARFTAPPTPQPTEQWFLQHRRLGLMEIPLMPESDLEGSCVVNGDTMIWATESANRYCSFLEEKLPNPSTDDCTKTDASATSYLTYLQSTGEFEDQYTFYLKEQWGERSIFAPHMDIPECQDQNQLPQKNGVVVRKKERKLLTNFSQTCRLFVNETECLDYGICEWRDDFGGRCRLNVSTTMTKITVNIYLAMVARYVEAC